jgi:hypothetical protein
MYTLKQHFENFENVDNLDKKNKTCSQTSINENIKDYIFDMKPFYR